MANEIETVYSGEDFIKSLTQKATPEKLTSSFTQSGLSATNAAELSSSRSKNDLFSSQKTMGKDEFLKLLTVQLKYQDPLNPMEDTQFIAQMAQFSELEGITNMSSGITSMDDSFHKSLTVQTESADALKNSMDAITNSLTSQSAASLAMNNALTAGLIGKDVRVKVDSLLMDMNNKGSMDAKTLTFHTDSPANDVEIRLLDADGTVVRSMKANSISDQYKDEQTGEYRITLEAKDNEGQPLMPGVYKLEIAAKLNSTPIDAYIFEQGSVNGITFGANGTMLDVKSYNPDIDEYYTSTMPIASIIAVKERVEN